MGGPGGGPGPSGDITSGLDGGKEPGGGCGDGVGPCKESNDASSVAVCCEAASRACELGLRPRGTSSTGGGCGECVPAPGGGTRVEPFAANAPTGGAAGGCGGGVRGGKDGVVV